MCNVLNVSRVLQASNTCHCCRESWTTRFSSVLDAEIKIGYYEVEGSYHIRYRCPTSTAATHLVSYHRNVAPFFQYQHHTNP